MLDLRGWKAIGRRGMVVAIVCLAAQAAVWAGCPSDDGFYEPGHFDADGDGYCGSAPCEDGSLPGDCDDTDAAVYPGADEACDGKDGDCDGEVPDDELDIDGDGYAPCAGDCDAIDPRVYPGADERCNGEDDDCDGSLPGDEADADGDGWMGCDGHPAGGDCDDHDPTTYPYAPELCDGVDNDCDPFSDETVDDDHDGLSECDGDCDDTDQHVHPGADELCDGADTDCNGVTPGDELDVDGDGFAACEGDCDEDDAGVSPSAAELCDDLDNDCDGMVDEACIGCDVWVPTDFASVNDAVNAAPSDGVVCVSPGVYAEKVVVDLQPVQLIGVAGSSQTVLDGEGSHRVLEVVNRFAAGSLIQGLTLRDGWDSYEGGCLYARDAEFRLVDVVVEGCEALYEGGGAFVGESDVQMEDVRFVGNVADYCGGGIQFDETNITIERAVFEANRADYQGGGIELRESHLEIEESVFARNEVGSGGGGICASDSESVSTLVVRACRFENNTAGYQGGAVKVGWNDELTVTSSIFSGNQAGYEGLALATDKASAVVTDVLFERNAGNEFNAWGTCESRSVVSVHGGDLEGDRWTVRENVSGSYTAVSVDESWAEEGRLSVRNAWIVSNVANYPVVQAGHGGYLALDHATIVGSEILRLDFHHPQAARRSS